MSLITLFSKIQGRLRYGQSLLLGRRLVRLTNHAPLISFTFDDFPRSALQTGGALLQEHGLGGTYYASFGLMDKNAPAGQIFSEKDLPELLTGGHELGCHTFDHCHSWNTQTLEFEESIIRNREALNQMLPGVSFHSLSYPLSIPKPGTKRRAGNHFFCCRGGGHHPLNYGYSDFNCLNAFFLEKSQGDASKVKALIDRNAQCRGWLILVTHDIAPHPSPFGCTPAFFKDILRYAIGSGALILPVAQASKRAADTEVKSPDKRGPRGGAT